MLMPRAILILIDKTAAIGGRNYAIDGAAVDQPPGRLVNCVPFSRRIGSMALMQDRLGNAAANRRHHPAIVSRRYLSLRTLCFLSRLVRASTPA